MKNPSDTKVTCSTCQALCCRLEVRLIDDSDDQVPMEFTEKCEDLYLVMARADDGFCLALDRSTMLCSIYEKRPYVCREYEMGGYDCLYERSQSLELDD